MCPLCISAAALAATGGMFGAGIGALILDLRSRRKENKDDDASNRNA
jgi:hypothetical protein